MRTLVGLGLIASVTLLPWLGWSLARRWWLSRREIQVLQAKYGDLDMFRERLKEWNVTREAGKRGR